MTVPPIDGATAAGRDAAIGRHLVATARVTPPVLAACEAEVRARPAGTRLASVLLERGAITLQALSVALHEMVDRAPWESATALAAAPSPAPSSEPGDRGRGELPADVARALRTGGAASWIGSRYVVVGELGRGGMGVVQRAWDTALHRAVAVKLLGLPGAPPPSEAQRRRFEREALAVARLRHPGIVAVHEVGAVPREPGGPGQPFIVMDLVDGASLELLLQRGGLAPRRVASVVRDVALALAHAHREGVVHRDVKPENILVEDGPQGRVYLTDFGLARGVPGREAEDGAGDALAERLTTTGQIMGTPAYMAPEQVTNRAGEVGPLTDVYAAGGVLYRALAGRPPFDDGEMMALLRRVLAEEPPPLRRLEPSVHPDLETIAHRCLEKEPARRYDGAAALAEDLTRFLDGQLIAARPIGRMGRARRWARRNRLLAGAVGLLAALGLLSLGGGAVLLAEMRRRVAAERASIVQRARDEAERARAAFERSRAALPATDAPSASDAPEIVRRRRERLLALGLEAMQKASALRELAPGDPEARRLAFLSTIDCGEAALLAEQWTVAATAFEGALALGVDDERSRTLLARVEAERGRVLDEHRAVVETVLAEVRSGAIDRRPSGHEDALFALVRLPEQQTVDLLVAALDEATDALVAVVRERLIAALEAGLAAARRGDAAAPEGAADVSDEEAAALREALAGWSPSGVVRDRTARSDPTLRRAVAIASAYIESTAPRLPAADVVERSTRRVLAGEQHRKLGERALGLARLCCEALGRIGIRERALDALARHLAAEMDDLRATAPAIALCRLGGEDAERTVLAARDRFGAVGSFWLRVGRYLPLTGAGPAPEASDHRALEERWMRRADADDRTGAIEDLTRALALEPDCVRCLGNRGSLFGELGEHERALADLGRVIELEPDLALAWSNRGNVHRHMGDDEKAIADYDRAIELDAGLVLAWQNRGDLRWRRGDLDGAHADLTRAIEIDPGFAIGWGTRAKVRRDMGDMAGAIADATRAIELDPSRAWPYCVRSQARRQSGDLADAIEDATRAIEIDARVAEAWLARAVARRERGDLDGAISDASRSIDLSPSWAEAWHERGLGRNTKGERAGAVADLERAVALAPGQASAWTNLAGARLLAGDAAGAVAAHDRALAIAPERPLLWINRGFARMQSGDETGAIEDFSHAIELDPTRAGAFVNRAVARYQAEDFRGALEDAERALALEPGDLHAIVMRGSARARLGERDGAIADLQRFVDGAPRNHPQLPSVREELRRLRSGDR